MLDNKQISCFGASHVDDEVIPCQRVLHELAAQRFLQVWHQGAPPKRDGKPYSQLSYDGLQNAVSRSFSRFLQSPWLQLVLVPPTRLGTGQDRTGQGTCNGTERACCAAQLPKHLASAVARRCRAQGPKAVHGTAAIQGTRIRVHQQRLIGKTPQPGPPSRCNRLSLTSLRTVHVLTVVPVRDAA